jgi:hypothetical protein
MAGKLLQLLELCMAVLSSCIHILFSEILDDITLNFHSLGLIQYSLRPISNRKLPRDHNLPTLLNTVCVVSPFINELIRKENDHCFRSSNCTVAARQPRTTAATAHGCHGTATAFFRCPHRWVPHRRLPSKKDNRISV